MKPQTSVWKLEEGLRVAREFEPTASECGFHVALGGSVLHKGKSIKDLDLFFYPHHSPQGESAGAKLRSALELKGVRNLERVKFYNDSKKVFKGSYQGKRIDFFFLE